MIKCRASIDFDFSLESQATNHCQNNNSCFTVYYKYWLATAYYIHVYCYFCAAAMQLTGVNATQNGTTIRVNWTPPDPAPSGYLIYYSATGDGGIVSVSSGSDNQVVITGRQAGRVYTISMVALSEHLPSVQTALVLAIQEGMKLLNLCHFIAIVSSHNL